MDRLRLGVEDGLEAELGEYSQHRRVFGQNFRCQFLQSGSPSDFDEMTHQNRADASRLPGIDDDKGHLGPPGRKDNVSSTPDDDLSVRFPGEDDKGDMIFEIDVHEEGAFLVGEVTLRREEAPLQRLRAGLPDSSEHVGLILRPKRSDFDRAAVA